MCDPVGVRTTLDIADDVLAAARELARLRGVSMGEVMSDLARRGLEADRGGTGPTPQVRAGIELLPPREGAGIVTSEHVGGLLDDPVRG